MKTPSLRALAFAAVAATTLFVGIGSASADVNVGIRVGGPPPRPVFERPWAAPYRGAVWIRPHQEWRGDRWVFVHGYYDYPPYPGAVWVEGRYRHGYWRPGHWARR